MSAFKNEILPAIANKDPKIIGCFSKVYVDFNDLPIEIELGKLFIITWVWVSESGIQLPSNSHFQKDFNEFCFQLMEPWPIAAFESANLKIQNTHISNFKYKHKYEISYM